MRDEKIRQLREVINKTVKEIIDTNIVEIKGWILIVVESAKWRRGSYGVHYIGNDIQYGFRTIYEEYYHAPEVFGESMKKWFKEVIER